MRNPILLFLMLCFFGCKESADKQMSNVIQIIPMPQEIILDNGQFQLRKELTISSNSELINSAITNLLKVNYEVSIKSGVQDADLIIQVDTIESDRPEYEILVSEKGVSINAENEEAGFYAIQTILQSIQKSEDGLFIPFMKIKDYPAFQHRGLLLDCSRHFFSVEVVKKYIDLLSYYKMNVLHWHLTEDQGWRIEIDKYPRLTEIGAWRTETDGSRYGGFYSKEEIRDIVSYAADRFVTVIPEIELPGHSQAALAAYPELSCIGQHGEIEVVNDWGVFKEIYCAGNHKTFDFLEDVLTEVMELFPSEYIHIGGDEAPKFRWEHCSKCQKRIEEEGLHNEHELQSYFIGRIEKFLNKNGRNMIGWDEIMEGGLSSNATVQSWRGMEYGSDAAMQKHNVIFSPTSHCYLDYDLKSIDLRKIYSFDPIPKDLESKYHEYVLGAEANIWTEHVPDESTLDKKVFPRLLALSEVTWTYDKDRDFDEFFNRVELQYPTLEKRGVNYGLEGEPVSISSNGEYLTLHPGVPNLNLSFSRNDDEFQNYTDSISIDFSGLLNVKATRKGIQYGETVTHQIKNQLALGRIPESKTNYSESYSAGGDLGLTDGLVASQDFRDGKWQGYYGDHIEIIIDLESDKEVRSISSNFYQYNNAWIFMPVEVVVSGSIDGNQWREIGSATPEMQAETRGKFIETFAIQSQDPVEIRYIKFEAKNMLKVPDWHEAAGSKAWLFIDEIIVE